MTEEKAEEIILVDQYGEWHCVCGNVPSLEGFHPCNYAGNSVEPEAGVWDVPLYRCDRCGRIVEDLSHPGNPDMARVIGRVDLDEVRP